MRQKLTPGIIRTAKPPAGVERCIIWDAGLPGFGLMVTAAGHKSFICQYRANGISRRYTIKSVLNLQSARKEARAILGDVAKGKDPLQARRKASAEATNTLRAIAEEYLSRDGSRLRSKRERRRIFEKYIYPRLGGRQIEGVRRVDVVRLLDHIEDSSGPVMADHVLAAIRKLFNWHAARSDDFRSPVVRGMARTRPRERRRQRILTDDELRSVWKTATGQKSVFGHLVRFILLTATRRNEAARMRRDEINGDEWVIPGARHKSKADFLLPLSEPAIAALTEVPMIGGSKGHVFTTDGKKPISGFSKFKREFDERCGVAGWTIHDLRRTSRSLMSRVGVEPDHAERALGHVMGAIRGTYDVHEFRNEKRRAFELLAAEIERIVTLQAK